MLAPRAFITTLGDSDVRVRYQGWVDQRSHDFAQVKSEAIRAVKLALEHAGMDLPEPIYRVQLSEPRSAKTRAAGDAVVRSADAAPPAPVPDVAPADEAQRTRARRDIEQQIDLEPTHAGDDNLLDPTAPRE